MQTFLTKTSFKKVVLLDYLLEKDNWCAMEELRNLLNVTEKSVLHYIEELEDLFKQYNGNILLKNEDNTIEISENIRRKAIIPLNKMLELAKQK